MKNKIEEKPNSVKKRASRELFYKKLTSQRKLLLEESKDLRKLSALKGGFTSEIDFELSDIDRIALDKHNSYMESESSKRIESVQGDIRLTAAIARGKE